MLSRSSLRHRAPAGKAAAGRKTPKCGSRCQRSSPPESGNAAPPSDAIVLFDGKNLDNWVENEDKSPAQWTVSDGLLTVNKVKGVRQYRNQAEVSELPASH